MAKDWWDESEEAAESFAASYEDLPLPTRPADVPFPGDLSEIHDAALSLQMTYLASLIGHAEYRLALIDAARTRLRMQFDLKTSEQFVALGPKMAATEKNRRIDLLAGVRAIRQELNEAEQHYMVLKALVSGYNVKMQAVSRELTRRVAEMRRE
jgi:hypothetical protein